MSESMFFANIHGNGNVVGRIISRCKIYIGADKSDVADALQEAEVKRDIEECRAQIWLLSNEGEQIEDRRGLFDAEYDNIFCSGFSSGLRQGVRRVVDEISAPRIARLQLLLGTQLCAACLLEHNPESRLQHLNEAIMNFRQAFSVITCADRPSFWPSARCRFGWVLVLRAISNPKATGDSRDERVGLLDEAVSAFDEALSLSALDPEASKKARDMKGGAIKARRKLLEGVL